MYAPAHQRYEFYEMGGFGIVFYLSHVVTIFVVANTIFWLKEIDPRFTTSEDNNYTNLPSVAALQKRKAEGGNFLLDNLRQELDVIKEDIEDFGSDFKSKATDLASGLVGGVTGRRKAASRADEEPPFDTERGPQKLPTDEERGKGKGKGARSPSVGGARAERSKARAMDDGQPGYEDEPLGKGVEGRDRGRGDDDTGNPMFEFL